MFVVRHTGPMRVLVTNAVCLNGGDAAIALATVQRLQAAFGPDTVVMIADNNPDVAGRLYTELRFVPQIQRRVKRLRLSGKAREAHRRINVARFLVSARHRGAAWLLLSDAERRELDFYRGFDLVLSSGGTILVENYVIWPRLFELLVAQRLGIPVVLFTQSLGPFRDPKNQRLIKQVCDGAAGVIVREKRSQAHLRILGADAFRADDVVFALRPDDVNYQRDRVAVVSVRDWKHDGADRDGYQRTIASLVTALVREHDLDVVFASTCQGVPEYSTDDSLVAQEIWGQLAPDVAARATVRIDFLHPQALQALLGRAVVAVCTRMHMAILALTVDTPVLPVAYEFKTQELFDRLGRGDDVLPYGGTEEALSKAKLASVIARSAPDVTALRTSALTSGALVQTLLPR